MKTLIEAVIVAAVVVAPAIALAQADSGLTRAQVRDELIELEANGYHPGDGDQTSYPAEIQAAEARVAAHNGMTASVGGKVSGSSASGAPARQ